MPANIRLRFLQAEYHWYFTQLCFVILWQSVTGLCCSLYLSCNENFLFAGSEHFSLIYSVSALRKMRSLWSSLWDMSADIRLFALNKLIFRFQLSRMSCIRHVFNSCCLYLGKVVDWPRCLAMKFSSQYLSCCRVGRYEELTRRWSSSRRKIPTLAANLHVGCEEVYWVCRWIEKLSLKSLSRNSAVHISGRL